MSKSFKKSGTFALKRSPSLDLPISPKYRPFTYNHVPTAKASADFPNSDPPIQLGEEQLNHFCHPQHPLVQVTLPYLFTCAGCKEYGAGTRFSCRTCDFQLHGFCFSAPPSLTGHSLHPQHKLVLHTKPAKGGILWPRCDICVKPTRGFVFRCSSCSFQLHPCCAMLSSEMKVPVHSHPIKLLPSTTTAANGEPGNACSECKRKRSGRVYGCAASCEYYVHAVCAKSMVNGLHTNGFKGVEKPSMFGTAARLASHVVIEFIGGLIEGLGEGVGEVIVQSVTKGRSSTRMTNLPNEHHN